MGQCTTVTCGALALRGCIFISGQILKKDCKDEVSAFSHDSLDMLKRADLIYAARCCLKSMDGV